MAVNIDEARRHPFTGRVDFQRSGGRGQIRAAHGLDHPVTENNRAVLDPPPVAVEHGGVANDGLDPRIRPVGRRVRIEIDVNWRRRLGLGLQ